MKLQLVVLILLIFVTNLSGQYVGQGNKTFTDDLYYIPSLSHMSLFQHKGEAVIDAFAISSFGINAAYAPINHLAVTGSFNYASRDERIITRMEVGAGYFGSFGRKQQWIYAFNVASGMGEANIHMQPENMKESLRFSNYSAHTSFGYRNRYVDVALSPRLCGFRFYDYKDQNGPESHPWLYGENLNDNSGTLLETALMVRAGGSNLKGFVQLEVPAMLNDSEWTVNFYDRLNFYAGISYRIIPKKKKDVSDTNGS